ncbi:hypothetical protein M5D96_010560 [Drosophila gunungcola]|uniref:Uncharacterized protein n=1 Tax=Drosophila gunungcola TaxID=103775 RepID=A0A9P9YGY3_9MUSC|nr:hypothetical protein M5D96_010560 [Drosophila gunungcola]
MLVLAQEEEEEVGVPHLDSKLRNMRGTARRLAVVRALRSTGQVGCRVSHSLMHPRQKACSHITA